MTQPRVKSVPRSSDERILHWMELRDKGWSFAKIANLYGRTYTAVQGAIARVEQDYQESETSNGLPQHPSDAA